METGNLSHLLSQFSQRPWYIRPEMLETFSKVLNDKLVLGQIINKGKVDAYPSQLYEEFGDVGVFNISGTLLDKASFMDSLCGFVSYQDISKALESSKANNIIYLFDSPGGSAIGCKLLAEEIYARRSDKVQVSFCTGQMCSAAYYLAAATDTIYAEENISAVGCIGTLMVHLDKSAKDEKEGLKYTFISSGEYKAGGNPHEPLPENIKSVLQKEVDFVAEQFFSDVLRYRNLTDKSAFDSGKTFLAEEALSIGLIDGIKTYKQFLSEEGI